jgi:hypothetical protein
MNTYYVTAYEKQEIGEEIQANSEEEARQIFQKDLEKGSVPHIGLGQIDDIQVEEQGNCLHDFQGGICKTCGEVGGDEL